MKKQNGSAFLNGVIIITITFLILGAGYLLLQKTSNEKNQINAVQIKNSASNLKQNAKMPIVQERTEQTESKIKSKTIVDCGEVGPNVSKTKVKERSDCIERNFRECNPAKFTASTSMGPTTYYYEVIGSSGKFCAVKSKFFRNPNPDFVGKEMVCQYDNTKDFKTAIQDISKCRGPLYNLMMGNRQPQSKLNCALRTNLVESVFHTKASQASVSVTGFKGKQNEVSWVSEDKNIATVSPSKGETVMVKSISGGSTKIIATDNSVGADCKTSIIIENQF